MKRLLLSLVAVAAVRFAWSVDCVRIDFTREEGPVKPLDGLCNSPLPFVPWENETLRDLTEIEQLGTPFVRLHDTGGSYGRNTLVDVPNVFRDMEADEDDPP